jgi:hypothetical protein
MSDLDIIKFDKLLSFWIMHNNQHEKDIEKWVLKIKKSFSEELGEELAKLVQKHHEMNKILESVKQKVRTGKYEKSDGVEKEQEEQELSKKLISSNLKHNFRILGTVRHT